MMRSIVSNAIALANDERGQGLVEYGLILMLISCAALIALRNLGANTNNNLYNKISNAVNGAM